MSAFQRLESKLAQRKGVYDPGGLAAYIGRRKLGKAAFQARARAGSLRAALKK